MSKKRGNKTIPKSRPRFWNSKRKKELREKIGATGKILLEFLERSGMATLEATGAFISSMGSTRKMARSLWISNRSYYSAMQNMKKQEYIRKINNDQFLIMPKALARARIVKAEVAEWDQDKWDRRWKIVSFDIPDPKSKERDVLRSLLKRKRFLGLQKSVFIAPYADFELLAQIRADLKIEKYVTFFVAECSDVDDDRLLRKKFGLS